MRVLTGTAVSPGYGEGIVFPYRRREHLFSVAARAAPQGEPAVEVQRVESARKAARLELDMLRDIAESADFLSLGTNDLLRHLFGRERGRVKETVYEPSLLRAIDAAVRLAEEKDREMGICGEVAGEPAFTSLLVGLRLRRFSMSPERLPEVRYNVSRIRASAAATLARRALDLKSADEVEHWLREHVDPWHQLLRTREEGER